MATLFDVAAADLDEILANFVAGLAPQLFLDCQDLKHAWYPAVAALTSRVVEQAMAPLAIAKVAAVDDDKHVCQSIVVGIVELVVAGAKVKIIK